MILSLFLHFFIVLVLITTPNLAINTQNQEQAITVQQPIDQPEELLQAAPPVEESEESEIAAIEAEAEGLVAEELVLGETAVTGETPVIALSPEALLIQTFQDYGIPLQDNQIKYGSLTIKQTDSVIELFWNNIPLTVEPEDFGEDYPGFIGKITNPNLTIADAHPLLKLTPFKNQKLTNVEISIFYDTPTPEVWLTGTLESLSIAKLGSIKTPTLSVSTTSYSPIPTIILGGTLEITLPFGWGKIGGNVEGSFVNNQFEFSAALEKDISIKNLITLKEPRAVFTSAGTLTLHGRGKVLGIDFNATASVIRRRGKKPDIQLKGEVLQEKPYYPFKKIPGLKEIPQLKKITLEQITLSLGSNKTIILSGISGVYGFKNKAKLTVTPQGIALSISIPQDWNITQAFPQAKGTILEQIALMDPVFIASSSRYFDQDLQINVNKGITISFNADLTQKPFKKVRNALEKFKIKGVPFPLPKSIRFSGTISTELQQTNISAILPLDLMIKENLIFKDLVLTIGGFPPAIFVKGNIYFKPQGQDEFLIFTGALQVSPTEAFEVALAGSMQGNWYDPFGLQGFIVKDVGIELGVSFTFIGGLLKRALGQVVGRVAGGAVGAAGAGAGAAPGEEVGGAAATTATSTTPDPIVISRIGMTGAIDIGDQSMAIAARIVPEMWYKVILMGKLKHLYITDILKEFIRLPEKLALKAQDTAKKTNKPLAKLSRKNKKLVDNIKKTFNVDKVLKTIPNVKFDDLEVYFAPLGGAIGEIYFEQGCTLKGKMAFNFLNKKEFKGLVHMELKPIPPVFTCIGTLSPISIAGLTITGAGTDGKYGTADDGPAVKMVLSLEEQSMVISGKTSFLGFSTNTDLIMSPTKFYFDSSVKLFHIFDSAIHCESELKDNDIQAKIEGHLKSRALNDLQKRIIKLLKKAKIPTKIAKSLSLNGAAFHGYLHDTELTLEVAFDIFNQTKSIKIKIDPQQSVDQLLHRIAQEIVEPIKKIELPKPKKIFRKIKKGLRL